ASQGSIRAQGGIQLGSGLVEGSLSWMKWPILRSPPRSYGGGIPLHSLQLRGAMHQRPGRDEMLLGLAEPGPPPLDQNARILFKGAASLQEPLQQDIQVTKAGTAKVPTTATLNPQNVRVMLTASNGLFSGTFRYLDEHPFDPRKPKILRNGLFRGLVIRRPGLDQGIGYFTLPRLPEDPAESPSATPILSGMAELLPP
ncbi:MAG: hypothetical protein LDL31_10575, partial [Prosthecobacter sp.]|nr:hypothetical protein [Prosthecobacter sp.]